MVFSPDESTFACISDRVVCVYDSETSHWVSSPFELPYHGFLHGAYFSPDGRHILLKFFSYAVVLDIVTGEEQFRIKGKDFVFICHDGRIASTHRIDQDGKVIRRIAWGDPEDEGGVRTGIVVKLWDASNGTLICNRLFEVDDVADTQFSPDGRFLAVERNSEYVIELWNLEDGKDPRRFSYPPGDLPSLDFSPTSDSLIAVSRKGYIYLWRLDTQEMASFRRDFGCVLFIHISPITYLSNKITPWRYGTSYGTSP